MPVTSSTHGASTSRKPWLLSALLAAAMLVGAPRPASASCISGDVNSLEALLRHALGSPGMDQGDGVMDTSQWQKTDNKAGCAVQGLAKLFSDVNAVVTDKGFKSAYFTMTRDGGDQVTTWIKNLRKNLGGQTIKSSPKVLVRGNGPAGLASAIYARKAGADVTVQAERFRYTRQHVVTLKLEAGHDKKDHPINGMSKLLQLTGLIKIDKSGAETEERIREVVPVESAGVNSEVYMQISSLELWLHLCAVVAGAKFNPAVGASKPGGQGVGDSRLEIRNKVAGSWTDKVSLPARSCDTEDEEPYEVEKLRALLNAHSTYDLVVGADGANSITRKLVFGTAKAAGTRIELKDQFFSRSCPVSKNSTAMDEASLFFRTSGTKGKLPDQAELKAEDLVKAKKLFGTSPHGGLAIAAFVVRGKKGEAPCGFLTRTSQQAEAIVEVFPKEFKPAPQTSHAQFCHVELIFNPDYGYRFGQILPSDSGCTFNFNVISPGAAGSDMEPRERLDTLRLLANLLAAHTGGLETGTEEDQVKDILSRVTEFKFFDNRMRVSMNENQQQILTSPRLNMAAMNPAEFWKRWTPLVSGLKPLPNDKGKVMLVGDAVRDANPDAGAGANDAHHGAEAVGELLKNLKTANADAFISNETNLTCELQKAAKGKLAAFRPTEELEPMTTVKLSDGTTLEMKYASGDSPSISVTRK